MVQSFHCKRRFFHVFIYLHELIGCVVFRKEKDVIVRKCNKFTVLLIVIIPLEIKIISLLHPLRGREADLDHDHTKGLFSTFI